MLYLRIRLAFASLLLCSSVAFAQAAGETITASGSKLSLREAITATLAHNPQLSSFQFRRQALAGEMQTAALKPELRLAATAENIAGSGDYAGGKGAELTLALSSVIELGDKRDARLGVITERQETQAIQQQIAELDVLAEVTRRFIEVASAQQLLALQQSTLALASETTRTIKNRVDAGNTPDAELARAQANQARANIELRQAQLRFQTAKLKLSALWAGTTPDFTYVQADLFSLGESRALSDLLASLNQNPDVQAFASEARLRDAELRMAMSLRKADVEWSAGIRRLNASDDSALVVGVSVPLFASQRATGEIANARANRLNVDNQHDAALLQLRTQLTGLYQEREAAIYASTSLRDDVIPQLKKAVSGARTALDKGRYGYLELSSAQHELLDAEAALIAAATNAHLLRAEIERLSGAATTASYFEQPVKPTKVVAP
ncbi:MAG TPA: TolC family protein [Cellvibrionaceae bacterium]